MSFPPVIYNSRNYSILLNQSFRLDRNKSTTVEIILYYLTLFTFFIRFISTTVEIILYYLTEGMDSVMVLSTTVEIILYYLTKWHSI